MRVLIVTEKPSMVEYIARSIQRVRPWPGAEVTIIMTMGMGLFRFQHPDDLCAADLPYVGEVRLRHGSFWQSHWTKRGGVPVWRGVVGDPDGAWIAASEEPVDATRRRVPGFFQVPRLTRAIGEPERLADVLTELLGRSDLVVDMTDADHRGAVSFLHVVSLGGRRAADAPGAPAGRYGWSAAIQDVAITSLAARDIDARLAALAIGVPPDVAAASGVRPWSADLPHCRYGVAKTHFDYLWTLNGAALLAAPLRASGVPGVVRWDNGRAWSAEERFEERQATALLSKYALLLLLHLVRVGVRPRKASEAEIIHLMDHWPGSGKYPVRRGGVGSEASRPTILQNLVRLGLVEHGHWVRRPGPEFRPQAAAFSALMAHPATRPLAAHVERLAAEGDEDGGGGDGGDNETDRRDLAAWLAATGLFRVHEETHTHDGGYTEVRRRIALVPGAVPPDGSLAAVLRDLEARVAKHHLAFWRLDAGALEQAGLLERLRPRGYRPVVVTEKGRRLADRLPKAAYDPDLPMRLDAWCADWPASRPAMEAYIRRFFGNIKRVSGMAELAGDAPDAAAAARGLLAAGLDAAAAAHAAQVPAAVVEAAAAGRPVSLGRARWRSPCAIGGRENPPGEPGAPEGAGYELASRDFKAS